MKSRPQTNGYLNPANVCCLSNIDLRYGLNEPSAMSRAPVRVNGLFDTDKITLSVEVFSFGFQNRYSIEEVRIISAIR